jgi:hypothetical protein
MLYSVGIAIRDRCRLPAFGLPSPGTFTAFRALGALRLATFDLAGFPAFAAPGFVAFRALVPFADLPLTGLAAFAGPFAFGAFRRFGVTPSP